MASKLIACCGNIAGQVAFEKELKSPKGPRELLNWYCKSLRSQQEGWLTSGITSLPGKLHEQAVMPGSPADSVASWIVLFSFHRHV